MQNGDLHLSVFWSDDKTWTRFNIDKETCVYTMTYKCRVGDKMARPLLSVPVFWSTLKGHGDRKSGLPVRIQKIKLWLMLMICILKWNKCLIIVIKEGEIGAVSHCLTRNWNVSTDFYMHIIQIKAMDTWHSWLFWK